MDMTLITTTIYVPRVLELYRRLNPDVSIVVAGNRKTPHDACPRFLRRSVTRCTSVMKSRRNLGYRSSPVIGWNRIMRRNVALLEAIKSGAEIIVQLSMTTTFRSTRATSPTSSGSSRSPSTESLFRPSVAGSTSASCSSQALPSRIPIHPPSRGPRYSDGGRCGGADRSCRRSLDGRPRYRRYGATSRINRSFITWPRSPTTPGLAVSPGCIAPFNTQNTAFLRELAPLLMASTSALVVTTTSGRRTSRRRRSCGEHGYRLHFGHTVCLAGPQSA